VARTFSLRHRYTGDGIDFADRLNEQQLAVATEPGGPMLVIAGAGTGKTRALIYRLAWLLDHGTAPFAILLVTFTNRAAREMLHRVELLVRQDARQVWGGTFHHVANRVLRKYGARLGIPADFTILDRQDAADLMASCASELPIPGRGRRFPNKTLLLSMASFAANTLRPLSDVVPARYPVFADAVESITEILEIYTRRKRQRHLLDYDDLLTDWMHLLEQCEDVRSRLAEQFVHVLVDEYQDTNAIQGRIVDLLASQHRNICVVGDDSQSIYSFRGAHFANIMGFRDRYPDVRQYRLEINYRSTPQILALANASIEHNSRRLPKQLHAVRTSGMKVAVVPCADHFVQSRFVAEYILQLLDEGRSLLDIAVLYRSHWHCMEIQMELQRRNIPFQVRGGLRFFEQAHMKDVLSFLRLCHNPRDELAWQRALCLFPRIGTALSRTIWSHVAAALDPADAVRRLQSCPGLPQKATRSCAMFSSLVEDLARIGAPAEMMDKVLDCFYDDYLVSHYENAALRRQDLRALAEFAGQYRTVEAFLSDVALTGDFDGETCVAGPDEQEYATLSTIHQAKGLEWAVVLIPWLADGRFPTDLAINTPEDLEEERRVFHVAVTRAKDELYLAVPQVWSNRGGHRLLMKPSRFLTELTEADMLETMYLDDDLPHLTAGQLS